MKSSFGEHFTIAVCLKIDPQQMSFGFLLGFLLLSIGLLWVVILRSMFQVEISVFSGNQQIKLGSMKGRLAVVFHIFFIQGVFFRK